MKYAQYVKKQCMRHAPGQTVERIKQVYVWIIAIEIAST